MRSFLFGLAIAFVLIAGAVAFRLIAPYAMRGKTGLKGCPVAAASVPHPVPTPGPLPGHPAPVPLNGSYFQTGIVSAQWGDGSPKEVPLDEATLQKGASLYARDCRTCHGAIGLGDGVMTRLPDGPRGVADLQAPDALARPDGEIFAIVTRGKGKMIGYGDTIPAGDRWAIVAYLRALQASQHATSADWAAISGLPPSRPRVPETGLGAPTAAEVERLTTAGWIDQKAGTVHIPVEHAGALVRRQHRNRPPLSPVPVDPAAALP